MTCSILLLEPDDALADLLSRSLGGRGHQVLRAAAIAPAVRLLGQVRLDLAIIDLVPSSEEWRQLWRFWRSHPLARQLKLLLLVDSVEEGQMLGDYGSVLVKPFRLQELEELVTSLHQVTGTPTPPNLAPLLSQLSIEAQIEVRLTLTEFHLLSHLMNNPGQALSSRRLLEQVWGYPEGAGSPELVRAHISNLRRKLRQSNPVLSQAIQTVPGQGYCLILPPTLLDEAPLLNGRD